MPGAPGSAFVPGGFCFLPKSRAANRGSSLGISLAERRRELAGSESVESAEAASEFGGDQAAFAVEPAEKERKRAQDGREARRASTVKR